ncbi:MULTISPECIES: hypothetical protein [Burkholderia]|uniref:hypothetical protein n=1 Tax=Burkholderia TaxID=32008 RepID=UPI00158EEA79|nr:MULTISPECIES: hypothetical protein [Burkholderia]MBR7944580.1 hypothetical protein [Burkholderia cenocepacia]MBR8400301.1 hypothetical protein [Burkholderia cenocepacia]CAG2381935.1 hypothetical protein BCCR12632_07156 [Burkholderia cenocepacia]CAG2381936.1 hypothetical protein BCCR75389_07113 [Burkholderia cenocepacia]CAG2381938.1 hypothetical protein BCCR75388_07121 [Burkholderia cenocepacia]
MIDETKSVTMAAFEAAMQRCADEADHEASFRQDGDGNYHQPEMRRALAGWLGAALLVAEHVRGFADIGADRFRGDPAFQSGFLEFLKQAADLLDLSSNELGSSAVTDVTDANPLTSAAAFDDAALDGFTSELKAKMAVGRAQGRTGWWGAQRDDLSTMLRSHVDKGDPIDIGLLAMMHWYKGEAIAPAPASPEIVAGGELTKISSSPVMGGQLDIRTPAGAIGITGFPNELARDCKPWLWEQVEIVIRSTAEARRAGAVKLDAGADRGVGCQDAAAPAVEHKA